MAALQTNKHEQGPNGDGSPVRDGRSSRQRRQLLFTLLGPTESTIALLERESGAGR